MQLGKQAGWQGKVISLIKEQTTILTKAINLRGGEGNLAETGVVCHLVPGPLGEATLCIALHYFIHKQFISWELFMKIIWSRTQVFNVSSYYLYTTYNLNRAFGSLSFYVWSLWLFDECELI